MEYKFTTHSERDTIELAQNFESEKFPNMIICLDGELGSGKTVFTKGIANALGINETITSPTFTKGGVVVIEWSETIKDILPKERLDIKFKILDENKRLLILKPYGKKYEDLCEAVL